LHGLGAAIEQHLKPDYSTHQMSFALTRKDMTHRSVILSEH